MAWSCNRLPAMSIYQSDHCHTGCHRFCVRVYVCACAWLIPIVCIAWSTPRCVADPAGSAAVAPRHVVGVRVPYTMVDTAGRAVAFPGARVGETDMAWPAIRCTTCHGSYTLWTMFSLTFVKGEVNTSLSIVLCLWPARSSHAGYLTPLRSGAEGRDSSCYPVAVLLSHILRGSLLGPSHAMSRHARVEVGMRGRRLIAFHVLSVSSH